MKYNRANINDTLRVAKAVSIKIRKPQYVYATACGYLIDNNPPAFAQAHYLVDGTYIEHRPTSTPPQG